MGEPVDPMAQLTARAADRAAAQAGRRCERRPTPPSPGHRRRVAHPTEARISATWDGYRAEVAADPERVRWTDAWRWSVSVDGVGVELDRGCEDWIDLALAAAADALPVGVAG